MITKASVKNFQIVHPEDDAYIIMQFGKYCPAGSMCVSDKCAQCKNSFTMDYSYPMSAVQAFGIAMSSLDKKMLCE